MQVTAKSDYALRAVVSLALQDGALRTRSELARDQSIPPKFLESILAELTRAGLLTARRGVGGGYVLGRPADSISVADVLRAVDGPLAGVRGESPEDVDYPDSSSALRDVWIAARASLRSVLETTTIADIAANSLPDSVLSLLDLPGVWQRR